MDCEKNKLNIKEAIDYIAEAWNNDVENLQETDSLNDSDIEINFDCLPEADLLREFFKEFDSEILTEEHLTTDEQIINI
ncbi:hypothetical protein RirG_102650 [Rhizophagus irregularis DAOM 197198w]|uniref:Uncharacterized protein n=1 Tax=Rhizophagus irregularis (strain DAOM 197198w) TaxID=1432141 RepID=A0A015KMJ5_RHIIW|nr:hypothetical protein RirG_102650 [Rhizophagus irregularis DAOM 197198w]